MQDSPVSLLLHAGVWLIELSHTPLVQAAAVALPVVVIALAGIWLRVQPQPFFLHSMIFNILLLAYLAVSHIPAAWFTQMMISISTSLYAPIIYQACLLLWLATSPRRYGRPSRELTAWVLLERRRWWLLGTFMAALASLLVDARGLWLPIRDHALFLWAALILLVMIIASVWSAKNFQAALTEGGLFIGALLAFILASYLDRFTQTAAAPLPLVAGQLLLMIHILLYYRRFIGLEAELRTGLYDENLTLREENLVQRSILAHTREAVLQLDIDERITYANPAFARTTGYELRQLRGRKFTDVVSRNFYEAATRALKAARRGNSERFEIMLHRQDGTDIALNMHALPLLDNRQKLRGIHLGFFDITESVRLRENLAMRLEEQEKDLTLYRSTLDSMENAAIISDTRGRILFVSKAFTSMTGYAATDLVGRSTNFYRLDTAAEREAMRALHERKSWKGTLKNRRKDGSEFEVDVFATPLLDESGELEYFLWVERDAAQRLKQESALQSAKLQVQAREASLQMLKEEQAAMYAALDTGIILVRPDGACRVLNVRASQILGINTDAVSLKNLPMFVRDLLRMGSNYGAKMRSEAIEFVDEFLRPDGDKRLLRWHAMYIGVREHRIGVLLQIFDITEYGHREQQLARLQKELESVRQQNAQADIASLGRIRHILAVAESVHSSMSFKEAMQRVVQTAQSLGWSHTAVYERRPGSARYELVAYTGFKPRVTSALHKLSASAVEQYYQSRYSIGSAYYLAPDSEENKTRWEFLPADLLLPAAGSWTPRHVLLLPLKFRGNQVGLFLCSARADGKAPDENLVQELEKLALYAAFAIDHGQRQLSLKQKMLQNQLLMDISKIEPVDAHLDREMSAILLKSRSIFGGEVAMFVSGMQTLTIVTAKGQNAKPGVSVLSRHRAEPLHAAIRPHLPASGAIYSDAAAVRDGLAKAMGIPSETARQGKVLLAPLQLRNRTRGYFCALILDGIFSEDRLNFASELAYRCALFAENLDLFSQIEAKAQELEKANTYISEFLANVTHELRTPLHTILSYVELLQQKRDASEADRLRYLQTIRTSGNRLLYLINDLLDLSKIEAGKMEPQMETFDPRDLVEEVSNEIAYLCNKHGLALKVSVNRNMPPLISSDKNTLSRVLLNLARNAQKFTNEGGTVEISAALAAGDRLILQVRDTGIGIPQSDLQNIFEPFNQLDRKASRRYEGTGLGLPISRRLIELLGGKISVQSKVGQGSTFTVDVPVQAIWKKGKDRTPPRKHQAVSAAKKPDRKGSKRGWQILVVDDDTSTKEAMRFLLENSGYQVEFAHDGPSAINTAQYLRPDLILMDIMMPGMDGYQVARTLKAQKNLNRIPLVALTARAMNEDRERALEAGFDDFLTKPFAMDEFFRLVQRYTDGNQK